MTTLLRKLDREDILELHSDLDNSLLLKDPAGVAIFVDEKLIGSVLFSNPTINKVSKTYTTELVGVKLLAEAPSEAIELLVQEYLLARKPADLFVKEALYKSAKLDSLSISFKSELRFEASGAGGRSWINPAVSYYCYKITAPTHDSKYYIGRKRINSAAPTVNECLSDRYFGSGGFRFKQWLASVGDMSLLKKEILGIYRSYEENLKAEESLIGDLFQTDPDCLNAIAGGAASPVLRARPKVELAHCELHGLVKYQGGVCATCNARASINQALCSIHGLVKHQGNTCTHCNSASSLLYSLCSIHGKSHHRNSVCMKCSAQEQLTSKECSIHGLVVHKGEACTHCTAAKGVNIRECSVHGLVKHQGSVCNSCNAQRSVTLKECSFHGLVKHQGSVCSTCNSKKNSSMRECPKHGLSKHQGQKCSSCTNESLIKIKDCSKHGPVKHRGKSCCECTAEKRKATWQRKLAEAKEAKHEDSL